MGFFKKLKPSKIFKSVFKATGVTSIFDTITGAGAQKKAAKDAKDAAEAARRDQIASEQQLRADTAPARELSLRAINTIAGTARPFSEFREGDDISQFALPSHLDDPLFRFQQEQGERAINRFNSAAGHNFSGVGAAALADYNRLITGEAIQRERGEQFQLAGINPNLALGVGQISQANATARGQIGQFGQQASSQFGVQAGLNTAQSIQQLGGAVAGGLTGGTGDLSTLFSGGAGGIRRSNIPFTLSG